jgi:hypothetical protein
LEPYSFGQTELLPWLNPFATNSLLGGWKHRLTGKFVAAMIYELQENVKNELIANFDIQGAQSTSMTDSTSPKQLILRGVALLITGVVGTARCRPRSTWQGDRP